MRRCLLDSADNWVGIRSYWLVTRWRQERLHSSCNVLNGLTQWRRCQYCPPLECSVRYSSVQFSLSVMSNSLWPPWTSATRLPSSSLTLGTYTNSCPSRWWCHPTISSSVIPFSSHLQSFPASGSLPLNWFFASGGQSIGVSASVSVLPMNIQGWCPLGL